MRCALQWLALAAIGLTVLGTEAPAFARPKVDWSRVEVPAGEGSDRLAKVLRAALEQAARKANFGKARSVTLSARVTSFSVEHHGDVLRISCTALGRVVGGQGAKSKISFG